MHKTEIILLNKNYIYITIILNRFIKLFEQNSRNVAILSDNAMKQYFTDINGDNKTMNKIFSFTY